MGRVKRGREQAERNRAKQKNEKKTRPYEYQCVVCLYFVQSEEMFCVVIFLLYVCVCVYVQSPPRAQSAHSLSLHCVRESFAYIHLVAAINP